MRDFTINFTPFFCKTKNIEALFIYYIFPFYYSKFFYDSSREPPLVKCFQMKANVAHESQARLFQI